MAVMHLNQIAGKTAVSVVTPDNEIVSAWIGDMFSEHFKKVIATGDGWEPDDVYKTETKCSTWPMGWEKEATVKYFKTKEELDAHVASYQEWAKCEDNQVSIKVFEWEFRPEYKETFTFG